MTPGDQLGDTRKGRSSSLAQDGGAPRSIARSAIAPQRSWRARVRAREPRFADTDGLLMDAMPGARASRESESILGVEKLQVVMRRAVSHPPLTRAQERAFFRDYQQGLRARERLTGEPDINPAMRGELEMLASDGELARETLIRCHVQVVAAIARVYDPEGLETADLVQEGTIGLMRAIEKFDEAHGVRFLSYAVWWIRQAIQRAVDNNARTIRLPVHICEMIREIAMIEEQYWREHQRDATDPEIAAALSVDLAQVAFVKRAAQTPLPLDARGDHDDPVKWCAGDLSLEELAIERERAEALAASLKTLDRRDGEVLRLRFGLGGESQRTLEQVGRAYGMTRERVRQIQVRATGKLADTPDLYKTILEMPPRTPEGPESEREEWLQITGQLLQLASPAARQELTNPRTAA